MAIQQIDSRLERVPVLLRERHYDEIVDFLSDDIPANLFQLCWLENHGVRAASRPELFAFRGLRDTSGQLRAVSLLITDRLVFIYANPPSAAEPFGRWYRRQALSFEHVVSPRESVQPFWEAYRGEEGGDRPSARLIRDQEMYVIEDETWQRHRAEGEDQRPEATEVRYARESDMEPLFLASVRMHREETLEDPLEEEPDRFRRHVRHRIESDRSFVWFDDRRRLLFKADISARGSFGVQISGVYTAPKFRGEGIATRGLYDICERLFDEGVPRVVLYVNEQNEPAIRVYQKVGFSYYTEYQTIFLKDEG